MFLLWLLKFISCPVLPAQNWISTCGQWDVLLPLACYPYFMPNSGNVHSAIPTENGDPAISVCSSGSVQVQSTAPEWLRILFSLKLLNSGIPGTPLGCGIPFPVVPGAPGEKQMFWCACPECQLCLGHSWCSKWSCGGIRGQILSCTPCPNLHGEQGKE